MRSAHAQITNLYVINCFKLFWLPPPITTSLKMRSVHAQITNLYVINCFKLCWLPPPITPLPTNPLLYFTSLFYYVIFKVLTCAVKNMPFISPTIRQFNQITYKTVCNMIVINLSSLHLRWVDEPVRLSNPSYWII